MQRNGYRERDWDTRTGRIALEIPKVRKGSFLAPRRTAGKALVAVIQEACVRGVSTRSVDDLVSTSELSIEGLMIPAFGDKSHVNVDRRFHFIRRFSVTDAARNDGAQLPALLNANAFDNRVWADRAYRSAKNEASIKAAGRFPKIHFRKPKGNAMPEPWRRANRARSAVRSSVEHVFAEQRARMGPFVRTIGLDRAKTKIGLAYPVHNFRRLTWFERGSAPA